MNRMRKGKATRSARPRPTAGTKKEEAIEKEKNSKDEDKDGEEGDGDGEKQLRKENTDEEFSVEKTLTGNVSPRKLEVGGHPVFEELLRQPSNQSLFSQKERLKDQKAFLLLELEKWPELEKSYEEKVRRMEEEMLKQEAMTIDALMKLTTSTMGGIMQRRLRMLISTQKAQSESMYNHFADQTHWMEISRRSLDNILKQEDASAEEERLLEQKVNQIVRTILDGSHKVVSPWQIMMCLLMRFFSAFF